MTKALAVALMGAAISIAIASPAWSHHSHAMYDHNNSRTVTGTVKEFVFRNPHVFLYLDVKNERGEMVTYWIEMSNIQIMLKQGVNQSTFKFGDALTVKMHPLKDGRLGGNYDSLTTADGRRFSYEGVYQ
jgi:uncharacterized protein DUF6152